MNCTRRRFPVDSVTSRIFIWVGLEDPCFFGRSSVPTLARYRVCEFDSNIFSLLHLHKNRLLTPARCKFLILRISMFKLDILLLKVGHTAIFANSLILLDQSSIGLQTTNSALCFSSDASMLPTEIWNSQLRPSCAHWDLQLAVKSGSAHWDLEFAVEV